jgi:hypothetical protein
MKPKCSTSEKCSENSESRELLGLLNGDYGACSKCKAALASALYYYKPHRGYLALLVCVEADCGYERVNL